ncbi:PSD1 and planctomycete cytochrome C domain-containing protein [Haloferula helveola]
MKFPAVPFALLAISPLSPAADVPGFNSDIRPLLSDRCFACHGFDANTREAGLRLDTPEGAYAELEDGPAIVPGKPDESSVWKRIMSKDPEVVMPPSTSHLKLSDDEKDLIRRWIEGGAKYEKHWTFVRAERPDVPEGSGHPIDDLVSERLREDSLELSPEADRRTLIRRLSFDLRGLPPTPEEVEAFVSDPADDAWEKVVDRFLADPAFGERMAWPWLDAARYADTNGFQGDDERTMWPWRDWVVDVFNRNLPYDDFTVWQIAGDLLPDATHEQKLATGFLRNHAINGEGGSIPEENRVNYVMDMSETVGTVWMGLTLNCCRCHDHKYDPLSQKEYYGLFDFFNQTPVDGSGGNPQTPPVISAPSESQAERELELAKRIPELESQLKILAVKVGPGQANWENARTSGTSASDSSWQTLDIEKIDSPHADFRILEDKSALVVGPVPDRGDYGVTLTAPPGPLAALRLEALRHKSMTQGGIAKSDSGNFVLTGFELFVVGPDGKRSKLPIKAAEATIEQRGLPVSAALDSDPATGWAVWQGKPIDRDHAAVFRLPEPVLIPAGSTLEVRLRHQSRYKKHLLGRFRISITDTAPPAVDRADPSLATAIRIPVANRSKEQAALVRSAYLESHPAYAELLAEVTRLRVERDKLTKSVPKVMIMADREKRRDSFILAIGSYEQPGEKVEAHTPATLPPLNVEGRPPNRLDLARWLVSRDHPLTARVTVNRFWQDLFGIGLIKSPEDFGVQSEIPKHGQLLDWLAVEFMESGWDTKHLLKTIVTSRTYRQSSRATSELLAADPDNRLLARGPRFRLPSWMIRDQALAVSGLLVPEIGGEPVFPWQPPGLWAEVTFGRRKKSYTPDTGEKLRRRSLYTFWRRISAPPMFFDNAKREMCEVGVGRTNSPLHALATLNDPIFAEASRALASRASEGRSDDPARTLARAFEIVLLRPPSEIESAVLMDSYREARSAFDPETAREFLSIGETPADPELDPVEHAALAAVCLSILNTDETLTKE